MSDKVFTIYPTQSHPRNLEERNGLFVQCDIMPGDNPCPWRHDPHKYGTVSEWTNRPMRDGEKLLHEVRAFEQSNAGRGKLYYDKTASARKFQRNRNTGTQWMNADFDRLQAWCQGKWYYVDIAVQVWANDDDDPRVLGACSMGMYESDDTVALEAGFERCVTNAMNEAYQKLWEGLTGEKPLERRKKR